MRRVPFHPVLVAAFPVLLLWALNVREVRPGDGLAVVGAAVAATLVVTAVAALALHGVRRGALVGSAVAAAALGHGYLWTPSQVVLPGVAVAAVFVLLVAWRSHVLDDDAVGRLTLGANVVAALLVVATLPAIVGTGSWAETQEGVAPIVATERAERDIVWIVPDRYGRQDILQDLMDVDTSAFVAALEQRGFAVADRATTNYPATSHALSAALNMAYLDDLLGEVPADQRSSIAPVYPLLRDHRLGHTLTGAGYEYVHIGNWWTPTATARTADVVLNRDPRSEFAEVWEETTILPPLSALWRSDEATTDRESKRLDAAWQLDALDEQVAQVVADTDDQPRFVFAHVTLPHGPYVFNADGSPADPPYEPERSRDEQYAIQTAYLDTRLLDVVDQLLAVPEEDRPIIVIHADEGPHPLAKETQLGESFAWDGDATSEDLRVKFGILSALYLPGVDADAVVPEDLSGVNVMRLVLNTYLGTDLEMLPDRTLVFGSNEDRYTFEDVGQIVRPDDPPG